MTPTHPEGSLYKDKSLTLLHPYLVPHFISILCKIPQACSVLLSMIQELTSSCINLSPLTSWPVDLLSTLPAWYCWPLWVPGSVLSNECYDLYNMSSAFRIMFTHWLLTQPVSFFICLQKICLPSLKMLSCP